MTVEWRFYPACPVCKAGPAKPCPGRFGARTTPHTGRRRQKTDQTPPPPPLVYCTAANPAYRFIRCSRLEHSGEATHTHYSGKYGLLMWQTEPYTAPAFG